jgi:hypothetical protein
MGGQIGVPALSVYHATKWGIEGFAETTKSVRSTDIFRADTRNHRICNVSAIVAALSNHAGLGARSQKPGYQWDHFIDGKVSLPTFGRYLSSFDPVRAQQRRRWPLGATRISNCSARNGLRGGRLARPPTHRAQICGCAISRSITWIAHLDCGISRDQSCEWGIEWDTCAPHIFESEEEAKAAVRETMRE